MTQNSRPFGSSNRTPRVRNASTVNPPPPPSKPCCPMVAAVRSARRGRWRLARRYAAMSFSIMMGV